MVPVAQIFRGDVPDVVPFPPHCDVLQVLWCPNDHHPGWVLPTIRWRNASAVSRVLHTAPTPAAPVEKYVPRPCIVHPEIVTEYPSWDLPEDIWNALEDRFVRVAEETGWDYQSHLSTAPGTKMIGYPGWVQEPQWPDCANCSQRMQHLLTVRSTEGDARSSRTWTPVETIGAGYEGPGLRLGDLGGVYLFECQICPGRPAAYRYDSC